MGVEIIDGSVATTPVKPYFKPHESLQAEMARIEEMRQQDPDKAAGLMALGEHLIKLAQTGDLRSLITTLDRMEKGELLQWFVVKMFQEACFHCRTHIVLFMAQGGVDVKMPPLRNLLHVLVAQAPIDDPAWTGLVQILASQGYNVNYQTPGDYRTALHVACERNMMGMAELLISHGADVNAVAEDDSMPLNCADRSAERLFKAMEASGGPRKEGETTALQRLLEAKGAKRSWRRDGQQVDEKSKIIQQRLQDFLDSEKESGGRRTFSGGF